MPQLMPLFWMMSNFFCMLFMISLVIMFSLSMGVNSRYCLGESIKELKWCW